MGHCVTAIIAPSTVVGRIVTGRALVAVDLRDGFRLIPLEDDDLDSLGLDFTQTAQGFNYLSPELTRFCSEFSIHGPLAYIETEYFGGSGGQGAAAFRSGSFIPNFPLVTDDAINAALHCIGVVRSPELDEFDYIGLSRYRNTSDWREAAVT